MKKELLCYPLLIIISLSFTFCKKSAIGYDTIDGDNYIFQNGRDGYPVFRIPAIIKTTHGRLLAFCEGRSSLADNGNIDIVMKSSDDDGKTWSAIKVIWNEGDNTCGNPTPVVDATTGDVIMVATLNNDKVYVLRSHTEGNSWYQPVEITRSVKQPDWNWYAAGPVHAIQLTNHDYKNRLVVPCNHTNRGSSPYISHIIYSDDGGATWSLGNSLPPNSNECTIAELTSGKLLLNMRTDDRALPNRKKSTSIDGGITWSYPSYDSALKDPVCQGALLSQPHTGMLLFSNLKTTNERKNLTLSVSYNDGETWSKTITVFSGRSAYSDLVFLSNGNVLSMFEAGDSTAQYKGIAVKVIDKGMLEK